MFEDQSTAIERQSSETWIRTALVFVFKRYLTPPISRLLGITRPPVARKFWKFGCRPNFLCSSKWPATFFEIWPLNWNMTPRRNTFVSFLKNHDTISFSQITFKRLSFVQIFFWNLRKSPEVILGHLGAYGVKFRPSPKVVKLYLKMKLLARTFQKS